MDSKKQGLVQALGVTGYCLAVGIIFWQGANIFPEVSPYFGPVMFLLLLCSSALICGLIVFYKPYKLFSEGKKKEAADTVIFTSVFLVIFAFTAFALMLLFK